MKRHGDAFPQPFHERHDPVARDLVLVAAEGREPSSSASRAALSAAVSALFATTSAGTGSPPKP
eukprot:4702-Pelagococcus_subviridis.AAC.3